MRTASEPAERWVGSETLRDSNGLRPSALTSRAVGVRSCDPGATFVCLLKPDLTSRGESRAFAVECFISTAYPTHHSDKLLAALGFIVLLFCCGA
jgi:hypothetical protein